MCLQSWCMVHDSHFYEKYKVKYRKEARSLLLHEALSAYFISR